MAWGRLAERDGDYRGCRRRRQPIHSPVEEGTGNWDDVTRAGLFGFLGVGGLEDLDVAGRAALSPALASLLAVLCSLLPRQPCSPAGQTSSARVIRVVVVVVDDGRLRPAAGSGQAADKQREGAPKTTELVLAAGLIASSSVGGSPGPCSLDFSALQPALGLACSRSSPSPTHAFHPEPAREELPFTSVHLCSPAFTCVHQC